MYYLLLAVFYPLSLLPLWMLYRLSDLAYVILFHLMGYRKDVVRSNLTHYEALLPLLLRPVD
jgi:KDO2-lipid IV(A) lauroyltransferase